MSESPEYREFKYSISQVVANLIGLPDAPEGDPHSAHHGVPDQPFVPHLYRQTQVQAVYFAGQEEEDKRQKSEEQCMTIHFKTSVESWYIYSTAGKCLIYFYITCLFPFDAT